MNKIETKRKELEDESKKIDLRTLNREYINFGTVWRFRENCISFGKKQGVELAQKEFSEIIDDELRIRQSLKPQTNAHLDRFANHLKTRLKQSLTRLKQSLNSQGGLKAINPECNSQGKDVTREPQALGDDEGENPSLDTHSPQTKPDRTVGFVIRDNKERLYPSLDGTKQDKTEDTRKGSEDKK